MDNTLKSKQDKEHYNTYSLFITLMQGTALTVGIILVLMANFLL